jgi:hypothetical protein
MDRDYIYFDEKGKAQFAESKEWYQKIENQVSKLYSMDIKMVDFKNNTNI